MGSILRYGRAVEAIYLVVLISAFVLIGVAGLVALAKLLGTRT